MLPSISSDAVNKLNIDFQDTVPIILGGRVLWGQDTDIKGHGSPNTAWH